MTGKRDTPLLSMLRQLSAWWLKRVPVSRRGRLDAEAPGPDSLPLPDYAAALTEFWRGAPQLNANRIWASVEAGLETTPQVAG